SHSAGPTTNFANFAHFSKPSGGGVSAPPLPSVSGADRYAALAELDSALSSTTQGSTAVPAPPVIPSMQQGFTGSMSMPSGFSNTPSFCLPTSFSGNFPHPFPPASYHQQPNGGFPVYAQKPQMSYGQPAVSNNPFM
ncbi:arf-GAP domain and FG repeat-containing protein 1b isoform X1, partial [Tachysurus ichikawai]